MSTHNMFLSRNKEKNIIWISHLICSYGKCYVDFIVFFSYKFNDFWDDLVLDMRAIEERAERMKAENSSAKAKLYTYIILG